MVEVHGRIRNSPPEMILIDVHKSKAIKLYEAVVERKHQNDKQLELYVYAKNQGSKSSQDHIHVQRVDVVGQVCPLQLHEAQTIAVSDEHRTQGIQSSTGRRCPGGWVKIR